MDLTGYKKTVLATTDRVQLILMLYDGALNHLKMARNKMQNNETAQKATHIVKVTSIVGELSSALDMEQGGEIAVNLRSLYDFIQRRLLIANMNNDTAAIDEAEKVIISIRDGWKEMMNEMKQQPLHVGA